MVLLNPQPVHSSVQHRKTDPRKTPQDMLAQGKENTGRKNDSPSPAVHLHGGEAPCSWEHEALKAEKGKGSWEQAASSEDGGALASTPRTAFIFLKFDISLIHSTHHPGNKNQIFTSSTQFHGFPKNLKFLWGSVYISIFCWLVSLLISCDSDNLAAAFFPRYLPCVIWSLSQILHHFYLMRIK